MTRERYESLPLATLKELAKARNMKGVSTLKKSALIDEMLKLDETEKQMQANEKAKEEGVTGSRIMGGGFGGCTINLVSDELYDNFVKVVKSKFKEKFGKEPVIIDVVIGDGSRKLC